MPSKPKWFADKDYKRLHIDKMIEGERWMLQKSRSIIANSSAIVRDIEQEYCLDLSGEHVHIVPHGLPPKTTPSRVHPSSTLRILFVGRFERRKGIDILLETIPIVLTQYSNIVFALVGDCNIDEDGFGPVYRRRIESLALQYPGCIELTGILSDVELSHQYDKADIFVAPSRYESFGLVFLEAMMHQTACIGTRVGGIPEVVADGLTGLLLPDLSPYSLAEALLTLIRDPELRNQLAENGLQAFCQRFTHETMASSIEKIYWGIYSGI